MARTVPALPTYTFSNGVEVRIRKVSPLLMSTLRRTFPLPPSAPSQPVMFDGEIRHEPNLADPDYQAALVEYQASIEETARRFYIKRGVECEVDQEAVAQLRRDMQELGVELDPDDLFVYVSYILCEQAEDSSGAV